MYPFFYLFGRPVSMFLTFVSLAFLGAAWLFRRNLMRQGHDKYAYLIPSFTALIVGFGGSGMLATLEHGSAQDLLRLQFFNHGLSILGGMIAVAMGFAVYAWKTKIPTLDLLSAGAAPLFLGYAIGRLACFFAGDGCYGIASDLPWAMAFPHGLRAIEVPVHPTPLYESLMAVVMLGVTQCLFLRGQDRITQWRVVGTMAAGLGVTRFLVEFVRRNPTYGELSQAQWISLGLIALAVFLWMTKGFSRRGSREHETRQTDIRLQPVK